MGFCSKNHELRDIELSDCRQLISVLLADNNAGIYIRNYLFVRPT